MTLTLTDALWPLALGAFLFAGTVKGLIGIGLPTATISVIAQVADPRLAVALLLFPALVTNTWQTWRSENLPRLLGQLWPFCLVMSVGIWFFSRYAAQAPTRWLVMACGIVIILTVVTNWLANPPAISKRWDKLAQSAAGVVAGFMGGLTSIWSPPIILYLLARRLPRDEFVAATGLLILTGTFPLLIGYWQSGLFTPTLAKQSAAMIIPTLAGYFLGEWLRKRLNPAQFRQVFLIAYLLMGLNLIRRALVT